MRGWTLWGQEPRVRTARYPACWAAAGLLRRFNEVSGIAALDDRVDGLRATEIIKSVRTRIGLSADHQETG